jgi:hypothetical protein
MRKTSTANAIGNTNVPPSAKTTDAGNHNHQGTAHARFTGKPHFVRKRPGIIIHPARMHHRQTITHDTAFKHFFARHWTRATIGKRTRHHAQGVNGAFNAAVHKVRTQRGQYVHSFGKRTLFPHHVPQTEIAVRIGFFRQVGGIGKRGASKGVGVGVVPVLQRRTKRTRQTRHKEETHELETHELETTTATPFEQHLTHTNHATRPSHGQTVRLRWLRAGPNWRT